MRNQIATLGLTERDFLPLWMRSAQEASVQELGYVTALPLCYTKPGYSDDILLRIQNSNFNFKQINFDIKTGMSPEELKEVIDQYDGILILSLIHI